MAEKTKIVEGKPLPISTGKTANINIKQYSNLLYEFNNIEDLDKNVILDEMLFWYDLVNEFDKKRDRKISKNEETIPGDIVEIKKCRACGSENLKFVQGTNAKSGKIWYAFECQECTEEFNGKTYRTKTFTDFKKDRMLEKVMEEDIPEQDIPF